MFVQPRVDRHGAQAARARRAVRSGSRTRASPRARRRPTNPLPFSRGNTPERVERAAEQAARGQGPQPDPAAGQQAQRSQTRRQQRRRTIAGARCAVRAAVAAPQTQRRELARTAAAVDAADRSATRCGICSATCSADRSTIRRAAAAVRAGDSVRHQGRRVRSVDPPLHRAGQAQLVHPVRGDVDRRGTSSITFNVHKDGSITDLHGGRAVRRSTRSTTPRSARSSASNPDAAAAAGVSVRQGVLHRHVLLQRNAAAVTRSQQLGLVILLLGVHRLRRHPRRDEAARRRDSRPDGHRQERAGAGARRALSTARSSTATRPPSIAASTSAPTRSPPAERRGIPHHLIDIVDPTDEYTAAQYARDAAAAHSRHSRARPAADSRRRHRVSTIRALTRGLFPGPGRDAALRGAARIDRRAPRRRRSCTGCCARVDPESARRIQPRDLKRIVRALEVFFLTGRPLTAHFAETASPIPDVDVLRDRRCGCRPRDDLGARDAARRRAVRARAARRDPRRCSRAACRRRARPFGGLVYRQALEHLHGVRDEAATRALIAQENRRYARRQLIWFRKEPNLSWFDGPGESPRDDRRRARACSTRRADTDRIAADVQ